MSNERFALSLQQDLLTLAVHSDEHGNTIVKMVPSNLFEGDYKTIYERAVSYWKQYSKAPQQHIADLLSDILDNKQDRRGQTYRNILVQMLEVKDQINPQFVLNNMNSFIRVQRMKSVILESAEQLEAKGVNGLAEVEATWQSFLKETDHLQMDPGIKLSEFDRVLEFTENLSNEFQTGIKELDEGFVVPMRGKLWILLAAAKKGKTWALVQLGKMAFMQRKKVLHVSLEIEAEEVVQRYYQSLFGASKRDDITRVSSFEYDRRGDLARITTHSEEVPFTFKSEAIREELEARIAHYNSRADYLRVKRFPMRSLTVDHLEAYLEYLETVEGFVPDLVAVDYLGIMKTDPKNHRISLGRLVEDFRGLAQKRNFAAVSVHQVGRVAADIDIVKSTHIAEDWSVICTADFALTYSQTAAERKLNLARLFVDAGRSEADKFGVLITQNYKIGQFVIESTRLSDSYADIIDGMRPEVDDEGEDDG